MAEKDGNKPQGRGRPVSNPVVSNQRRASQREWEMKNKEKRRVKNAQFRRIKLHTSTVEEWRRLKEDVSASGDATMSDANFAEVLVKV